MNDTAVRSSARNRALVRAGATAVAARASTTLATLLLTPVLVHFLGIFGYGVFVTLTLTASLLLLGDLGVASGLVTRLSGNRRGDDVGRAAISSAYAVVLGTTAVGLGIAALLAVALPWARWTSAPGMDDGDVALAAFFALAGAALQMTTNLGQKIELAFQRGDVAARWLGVANVGAPVVATLVAAGTRDVVWAVAAMALTPPLVLLVQSAIVLRRLPESLRPARRHVSRASVKDLLGTGIQFSAIALLGAIAFQLDTLIVSSFLGADAAAQYSVTLRLFALVSTTIHVASTQLWSAFADASKHGDARWARRTLLRVGAAVVVLASLGSLVLVLVGEHVVRLWIGEDFVSSTALFLAAALWTVVSSAAAPLAFFLNGNEKVRQQLVVGVPMVVANLGLSIWWVQLFGVSGVLWASSVAWLVFVSVPLVLVARGVLRDLEADAAARGSGADGSDGEGTGDVADDGGDEPADPLAGPVIDPDPTRAPEPVPVAVVLDEPLPARRDDDADPLTSPAVVGADPSGTPRTAAGRYRADVDGLRAGAVLAVIGFHFFPALVPGGFVGVDVFFVLSGFLITGLVMHRIGAGTFTIRDFYARRVRRIFPALVLVIAAVLVVGWVVLFTDELRVVGQQAAAGAFFVANLYFWSEASYFDPGAYAKPLQHLWSLAIEEQFYLVWPLLLAFLARRGRRLLLVVVVLLTVASFAFNLQQAVADPTADYYSPLTRFWQLSAGGLLALTGWTCARAWSANVAAVVGAMLVGASALLLGSGVPYPGAYGLAPVLGTVLLVAAGPRSLLNRTVLSWRWVVGIGLISYPLYLWHWPLVSYATIVGQGLPSAAVRLLLVVAAFGLAYVTYRLVERPFRVGRLAPRAPLRLAGAMAVVGAAALVLSTSAGPGAAHRADSGPLAQVGSWDHLTNATCDERYPFEDKVGGWWFCVTNADAEPDVLLLGDSLANSLYPGFREEYPDRTVLSIGTCAPTRGITLEPLAATAGNPCFAPGAEKQETFMDGVVADHPADLVVVDVTWPRFDAAGDWVDDAGNPAGDIVDRADASSTGGAMTDREAWVAGLDRRLDDLGDARIVLLGPLPAIDYDVRACFDRPFNAATQDCTEPAAEQAARVADWRSVVDEVVVGRDDVTVVDPSPVFCDAVTCSVVQDGRPLLRDQVHLSELGSDRVAAYVAEQLDRP